MNFENDLFFNGKARKGDRPSALNLIGPFVTSAMETGLMSLLVEGAVSFPFPCGVGNGFCLCVHFQFPYKRIDLVFRHPVRSFSVSINLFSENLFAFIFRVNTVFVSFPLVFFLARHLKHVCVTSVPVG